MTSLPSDPNGSAHTPIAAIRHAWSGVRAATTSTAAQGTPPLVSRRNYTGQILDATGLLFYNARYYDPGIGRFLSADTVVPGAPSGTMNGVAVTPLTVDFHEGGFRSKLNSESKSPFWFQMDSDARQQHGSPMGPANPHLKAPASPRLRGGKCGAEVDVAPALHPTRNMRYNRDVLSVICTNMW
jgi:RHS repeat-associated protein